MDMTSANYLETDRTHAPKEATASPAVQWANAVLDETERRMKAQLVGTAVECLESRAGSTSPMVPDNVKDVISKWLQGTRPESILT